MADEWEEEEQLVVVELSGVINNDFLSKCRGTCKILDVDSEKPMMQVGQYVFVGEYEDALGTCVLFEEGPSNAGGAGGTPELKYMCHTVKRLMMQRVFLTEKKEGETSTGSSVSAEQTEATCQSSQQSEDTKSPEEAESSQQSEDTKPQEEAEQMREPDLEDMAVG